jgi:hypothetical protein
VCNAARSLRPTPHCLLRRPHLLLRALSDTWSERQPLAFLGAAFPSSWFLTTVILTLCVASGGAVPECPTKPQASCVRRASAGGLVECSLCSRGEGVGNQSTSPCRMPEEISGRRGIGQAGVEVIYVLGPWYSRISKTKSGPRPRWRVGSPATAPAPAHRTQVLCLVVFAPLAGLWYAVCSMHVWVCRLSVCLSVCCLSLFLSVCCLSVCLSVCLPVCLSASHSFDHTASLPNSSRVRGARQEIAMCFVLRAASCEVELRSSMEMEMEMQPQ